MVAVFGNGSEFEILLHKHTDLLVNHFVSGVSQESLYLGVGEVVAFNGLLDNCGESRLGLFGFRHALLLRPRWRSRAGCFMLLSR